MKINKVTQAFKVADILPRDDTSSHIIKMFWYEEKKLDMESIIRRNSDKHNKED